MSIAPIVRSVRTKAPPERAFQLFATRIADWWPKGRTIGAQPHVTIEIEPHPGGRWYERDAEGHETRWGTVKAYEPPVRLLLAWQIKPDWTFDPDFATEVEVTFAPAEDGGTLVTLEHRHLERFGAAAQDQAEKLGGGWPKFLGLFADFADTHQEQ